MAPRLDIVVPVYRERSQGSSRFQVLKWLPAYLRWYGYAFATTFLLAPANSVKLRSSWNSAT